MTAKRTAAAAMMLLAMLADASAFATSSPFATRQETRPVEEVETVVAPEWDAHEDDEREDGGASEFLDSLESFQELRRSTGSEILDQQLQQLVDDANPNPNTFLDAFAEDGSLAEKMAMATIPEQLPRRAVSALGQKKRLKRAFGESERSLEVRRRQHSLGFSTARVTREEELELATLIQRGVALHKLRERARGRTVTRQEWADLAGLDSVSELRRQVSEYRRAKRLLVAANMGLVHAVVKSQFGARSAKTGIDFQDMVQEGSLGLIRAAELFDPNRGLRFSTYATIWIKGMLSHSTVDELIKLPAREKTKWNKINKARQDLIQEKGGAEPTIEEIAAHLDMPVPVVVAVKEKMTGSKQVLSLDLQFQGQTRSGDATSSGAGVFDADKNFREDADLAERTHMRADIVATMARNLDARESRLMRLRYGLSDDRPRSLTECAEAMGISQALASRIARKCLEKLREADDAASLEEYLLTIA